MLSRDRLLERVWGYERLIETRSVDVHTVDGNRDRIEVGDEMFAAIHRRRPGILGAAAAHDGAHAQTFGGILALPLVPVLMAAPFVHFRHEHRFNRDLLYGLVSRPDRAERLAPGLAA